MEESLSHSSAPPPASAPLEGDVVRVIRDDGSIDAAHDPRASDDLALSIYEAMLFVRLLDTRLVALQAAGKIAFHAGSHGEEAAIVGAAAAMREQDWLFPSSREFGAALYRGMPLAAYVHQAFGNARDAAKGRQMPDHYSCRAAKCASISSPIGTQLVHAAGFAWAAKIRKDELVTLVFFGDGATSSEGFHNGVNFAGAFKTPTVFFCRNNGWALSLPTSRQTASESLAVKGIAYGVPFVRVDGNDALAVLSVTRDAIARAAAGHGPTLIEALTDSSRRDPLLRLRGYLSSKDLWSDAKQAAYEAKAEAEIAEAIASAGATPLPDRATMFDDVYAALPPHLRDQKETTWRR